MKYWEPLNTQHILEVCGDSKLVLDVGGRKDRGLPGAETVGWEGEVEIDLETDRLPYSDKQVDFLYCRHTIEDLANPTRLLREIQRVAKRGYIETPSALAETTRGVDAYGSHLGYGHHRWICGVVEGMFVCLAKYPIIERLPLRDHWETLQANPQSWNTCHFFEDLEFGVFQNEQGFKLSHLCPERLIPKEYLKFINELVDAYEPLTVSHDAESYAGTNR